ncbi:unnamed protein product [Closterium sp. NIES-65]|nr:unnamed protein product [Closterium sp. NIES-65]
MGNSSSISAAAVEEAKIQTHMTDEEVQRLKRRFQKFVGKRNTEATLEEFSSLPELSNNPYVPRLFALMDLDRNGKINFLEFCLGMGMYRSLRKTRDGKIQLLMKLHDRDNDGKLSISELTDLLSVTAGKSLSAELLGQAASSLLSAYDADKDDPAVSASPPCGPTSAMRPLASVALTPLAKWKLKGAAKAAKAQPMPSLLQELARLGPLRVHLVDGAVVAEVTATQAAVLEAAAFGREMGDWGGGITRMSEPAVEKTAGESELREEAESAASIRTQEDSAARAAKEDETGFSSATAAGAAAVAAAGGTLLLLFLRTRSGTSVNLDWLSGFRAAATATTPGATVTASAARAVVALVAMTTVTIAGVAVGMLPSIRRILQHSTKRGNVDCFDMSSVSIPLSNELPSCIVLLSLEELVFLCTHVKCMVYVDHDTNMHTACEGDLERRAEQQSMKRRDEPAAAAPSQQLGFQQTSNTEDVGRRDCSGGDGNWSGSASRDSSRGDEHSLGPTATWAEVKDQELVQYGEVWRRGFGAMAAVYGLLRGRNWVVRPGLQFGSHFTAYQHHPALVHSNFMVLVSGPRLNNAIPTWNDLHATVRLASTVAKKLLIAYVDAEKADEDGFKGLEADMLGTEITEASTGGA